MNKILFLILLTLLINEEVRCAPAGGDFLDMLTEKTRGVYTSLINYKNDVATLQRFYRFLNLPIDVQLAVEPNKSGKVGQDGFEVVTYAITQYLTEFYEYLGRARPESPASIEEVRLTLTIIYKINMRKTIYSPILVDWEGEQMQASINTFYAYNSKTIDELPKEVDLTGSIDDTETLIVQFLIVENKIGKPTEEVVVKDNLKTLFNSAISSPRQGPQDNAPPVLSTSDRMYQLFTDSVKTRTAGPGGWDATPVYSGRMELANSLIGTARLILNPNIDAIYQSRSLSSTAVLPTIPQQVLDIQYSICVSTIHLLEIAYINADRINIRKERDPQIQIIHDRLFLHGYFHCAQPGWNREPGHPDSMQNRFFHAANNFCGVFQHKQLLNGQCNPMQQQQRPPPPHGGPLERQYSTQPPPQYGATADTTVYNSEAYGGQFQQAQPAPDPRMHSPPPPVPTNRPEGIDQAHLYHDMPPPLSPVGSSGMHHPQHNAQLHPPSPVHDPGTHNPLYDAHFRHQQMATSPQNGPAPVLTGSDMYNAPYDPQLHHHPMSSTPSSMYSASQPSPSPPSTPYTPPNAIPVYLPGVSSPSPPGVHPREMSRSISPSSLSSPTPISSSQPPPAESHLSPPPIMTSRSISASSPSVNSSSLPLSSESQLPPTPLVTSRSIPSSSDTRHSEIPSSTPTPSRSSIPPRVRESARAPIHRRVPPPLSTPRPSSSSTPAERHIPPAPIPDHSNASPLDTSQSTIPPSSSPDVPIPVTKTREAPGAALSREPSPPSTPSSSSPSPPVDSQASPTPPTVSRSISSSPDELSQ